jgi:RNA polymerase-binding transcription factor DksA
MHESESLQLIELTEKRICELESVLSECRSVSEKKQSQAGDAAANLDLTISAHVDEKILSEHKLELAQLRKNLLWLQTDDAGVCVRCDSNIPINRLKALLSTRLCVACADNNKD